MVIASEFCFIKPVIVQVSQSGKRLDCVLAELLSNYSRSQIKRWILSRKVTVNNKITIIPKQKMIGGEFIEIKNIVNTQKNVIPQDIPLDIVYEDNDIVVINKAKDMVVHPGAGNYYGTVLNALLYRYPTIGEIFRAGIVQRLDKDTTGLMVVAKNIVAYNNLIQLFKERKVIREYEAIVLGNFPYNTGVINKPIRRHSIHRTRMAVDTTGKSAITHYFVIEQFNMYTRVRVCLKTGRTHQIRVHMAYINHPLVGDKKYGRLHCFVSSMSDVMNDYLRVFPRQALHASILQLYHPITKIKMRWHISLPQDMVDLISVLRKN